MRSNKAQSLNWQFNSSPYVERVPRSQTDDTHQRNKSVSTLGSPELLGKRCSRIPNLVAVETLRGRSNIRSGPNLRVPSSKQVKLSLQNPAQINRKRTVARGARQKSATINYYGSEIESREKNRCRFSQ